MRHVRSLIPSAAVLLLHGLAYGEPIQQSVPTCGVGTALSYGNYTEGCSLAWGNLTFTFKNFQFSSGTTNDGFIPVSAADVGVVPFANATDLALQLYAPITFSVGAGQKKQIKFEYVLDPPPPILEDLSMEMEANSPVAPGLALIETEVCAGRMFDQHGCDEEEGGEYRELLLEHYGPGDPRNTLTGSIRFTPTYLYHVRTTITLDGGALFGGGSSQINGLSFTSSPIPEPGSFALLGGGLLMAAFARRARYSRRPER